MMQELEIKRARTESFLLNLVYWFSADLLMRGRHEQCASQYELGVWLSQMRYAVQTECIKAGQHTHMLIGFQVSTAIRLLAISGSSDSFSVLPPYYVAS